MGQLDGRTALVTGGSRGIGAAIATRLAHEGANVVITYARAADRARALVDGLAGKALAVRAEATDTARLRQAVTRAVDAFGGLDILVNNAGIAPYGPFEDVTEADIDRILAVHVRAAFVLAQAASPHLGEGGRIITIGSSLAERVPYPGWALYAMSKSALVGLTKGLARDLGPRGITVNLVHPGSTDTEMNPADGPDADEERRYTALNRYCSPEDVAATVAHLAGEGGRNITGASFLVDAGAVA
ncbi:NAD(P)-dependent dehydrogenase (short-subunit alcohol dehydrogenase family) [Saccharothrix tamanrassetensis]|uniref:NAD(P)-dependent dehydrogenase (Short-subunit alcohol dehydrogenase family) n=1 Tax=Saccharothrix tamanrassetensis TaxID=1051531 RepID=A0A841CC73_9PSEU|nr:SDR family oxidoreductase [Saccharothrix tamanrassetensis]MBB5954580.1 NAD(P)-dependent dehydrogenase (short-subunit alcohol dehydrogenase family) [Saccharothrix tamanrassetensis]